MMEQNPFSISSDDECFPVLFALGRGDLDPLIGILEQGTVALHPLLQRELAKMFRGTHPAYNLIIRRASRGAPKSRTSADARRDSEIFNLVASCEMSNPKLERKQYYGMVADILNIKDEAVKKAYLRVRGRHNRLRRIMQAHAARS